MFLLLKSRIAMRLSCAALTAAAVCLGVDAAVAQLQITELMSDPNNEDAWEWIEVRNTGAAAVNLNGYIIDRIGDPPAATPTAINGSLALNTTIPAGGVAVLYDADLSGPGDYDDQAFRSAWGLSASVPLVALPNFGPTLTNNPGTAIGFWADSTAYANDTADDGTGTIRVAQLTNAAFGLDFRTASGFPSISNGVSATWNGSGSYQSGANWASSVLGVGGAVTSSAVTLPGAQFNSSTDTGNPGRIPAGPAASGLLITEIMYNPASPAVSSDERWEWVEILNNTASSIDFGNPASNYFLHDNDGADLTARNITSGVLPVGGVAVLFNNAITTQNMIDAWDPGGTLGTLFIPVANFPALSNSGDTVAVWDSAADYNADSAGVTGRGVANAAASVAYDDEGSTSNPTGWPNAMDKASIYLTNLTTDPNTGTNWIDSFIGDAIGSVTAGVVTANVQIHAGGDLGSPGSFGAVVPPGDDADFDNDSDVDGRDFLIWQRGVGVGTTNATGDANGNGVVNGADLTIWRAQFGPAAVAAVGAVPEPAMFTLLGLGIAACGLARRGRRAK